MRCLRARVRQRRGEFPAGHVLPESCLQKMDDAWVTLENAERMLAGRNRSSQWWGRLCNLRLRIFALHAAYKRWRKAILEKDERAMLPVFRLLAFRKQVDQHTHLMHLLKLGRAVWPDDPFRRMRLADYFVDAWEYDGNAEGKLARYKEACELLEQVMELGNYYILKKNNYGYLMEFRDKVVKKIKKHEIIIQN
jgi:hypothetical protein